MPSTLFRRYFTTATFPKLFEITLLLQYWKANKRELPQNATSREANQSQPAYILIFIEGLTDTYHQLGPIVQTFYFRHIDRSPAASHITDLAAMAYSPSRTRSPSHFYTSNVTASLLSDTKTSPSFPDAYKNLCEFIDACTYPNQILLFISQSARFDAAFLSAELEQANFEASACQFCCGMRALSSAFFIFENSDGGGEYWKRALFCRLHMKGGRSDGPEVEVRALRDALLDSKKNVFAKREIGSSFGEIAQTLPALAQEHMPEIERLSGMYFASTPTCETSPFSKIDNDVFHIGSASSKKSGIYAEKSDQSLSLEFTSKTSQFVTFERRKPRKKIKNSNQRKLLKTDKRESFSLKLRTNSEHTDSEHSARNTVPCKFINRKILRNQYGSSFCLTKYGAKFHLPFCRHVVGKTNCSILSPEDECIDPCKHCLLKLHQTWIANGFTTFF